MPQTSPQKERTPPSSGVTAAGAAAALRAKAASTTTPTAATDATAGAITHQHQHQHQHQQPPATRGAPDAPWKDRGDRGSRGRGASHVDDSKPLVEIINDEASKKSGKWNDETMILGTAILALEGHKTKNTLQQALSVVKPNDSMHVLRGILKKWHEENGIFTQCVRCILLRKKCTHNVPCEPCKDDKAVCYVSPCPYETNCYRNNCHFLHEGYIILVANALIKEGRNGMWISHQFFMVVHLWYIPDPTIWSGTKNNKPTDIPPPGSAKPLNLMDRNLDPRRLELVGQEPGWVELTRDINAYLARRENKQKEIRDAQKVDDDNKSKGNNKSSDAQARELPQQICQDAGHKNASEWKKVDAEGYQKARAKWLDEQHANLTQQITGMSLNSQQSEEKTPSNETTPQKEGTPKKAEGQGGSKPSAPPGGAQVLPYPYA